MFSKFCFWLLLTVLSASALAQHDPRQIAEDIQRHQALSEAMAALGQCYGNAATRADCIARTLPECQGLGIGRNCGLRDEAMHDPARAYATTAQAQHAASQCLANGKAYEDCIWDLQGACKGLGVGKFCGMLHVHSF